MDWERFIVQVSEGLKDLCIGSISSYSKNLEKEIKTYLEKSKQNIEEWSQQVLSGELSIEDYESLIKRQIAGAEFIAIKQVGISKIELEKFGSGVVKLITNSAFRGIV